MSNKKIHFHAKNVLFLKKSAFFPLKRHKISIFRSVLMYKKVKYFFHVCKFDTKFLQSGPGCPLFISETYKTFKRAFPFNSHLFPEFLLFQSFFDSWIHIIFNLFCWIIRKFPWVFVSTRHFFHTFSIFNFC